MLYRNRGHYCGEFGTGIPPGISAERAGIVLDLQADKDQRHDDANRADNLREAGQLFERHGIHPVSLELTSVETHRTDNSNSNTQDNSMTSNSLKAQGKSVMHPVLTEVSLRNC